MTTLNDFLGDLRHRMAPSAAGWEPHWTYNGSYLTPPFPAGSTQEQQLIQPHIDTEWIWNPAKRDTAALVQMDLSGAWVSAIGQADLSFYRLEERRDLPFEGQPGYWQVEIPEWEFADVFLPPWGQKAKEGQLRWVTTPTLKLMHELHDEGLLADKPRLGHQSHIGLRTVNLRTWAQHLREQRTQYRENPALKSEYEDYKKLYAQAVNSFGKAGNNKPDNKRGSGIWRPDWKHTIQAHHAAMMWRRAWTCIANDAPIVATGRQDALFLAPEDFERLEAKLQLGPVSWTSYHRTVTQKGPRFGQPKILGSIRWDETGSTVGTFKRKGI